MTQKEALTELCTQLAQRMNAVFIGYNVAHGGKMYGTLVDVPQHRLIETPCAENLMLGMGVGLALEQSRLPVVCFERHEFALFAFGQLAVMADKLHNVSGNRIPMVVRIIRGATKPLWPGEQHCTDYASVIKAACSGSVVIEAKYGITFDHVFGALGESPSGMVIILEERDGYEQTVG